MAELSGKVALITGGSTGIGLATAELFARQGAAVVIADVNAAAAEQAVAQLRAAGGEALFVKTDVSNPQDCERMMEETMQAYGRLDFAFNNAGISGGDQPQPTADYGLDLWHKVININLSGVYYCLRAQIPAMLKNGGGAIVNTSSVAGQIAFPGTAAYTASKHGVVGLTKVVAAEYSAQGIRCNARHRPGLYRNADDAQRVRLRASAAVGAGHLPGRAHRPAGRNRQRGVLAVPSRLVLPHRSLFAGRRRPARQTLATNLVGRVSRHGVTRQN
jgi:NAD(P)-dependent dehydrogenase (short-subunit alcohol dehydrogenase family)